MSACDHRQGLHVLLQERNKRHHDNSSQLVLSHAMGSAQLTNKHS